MLYLFDFELLLVGDFLSGEVRYYRGLYRVRVVTQSVGYWIVEALEEFEDVIDSEKSKVKVGEQRIVSPNLVYKEKTLPPMVKEHEYELRMEKKLKKLVEEQEERKSS